MLLYYCLDLTICPQYCTEACCPWELTIPLTCHDCCLRVNPAKAPAKPRILDSLLGLFLLPDLIPLHHLQPRWEDHKSPGMHSKQRTCDCSKASHSFQDLESVCLQKHIFPLGPRWESSIPTSSEIQRPSCSWTSHNKIRLLELPSIFPILLTHNSPSF